jgi:hypothetical protein
MWIKQKVKNKAGEFVSRPVWQEQTEQQIEQKIEEPIITGGTGVDFVNETLPLSYSGITIPEGESGSSEESNTLEFIENSTVPKRKGRGKK